VTTTRTFKTAKQNIYRNLVLRTAKLALDDDEELDQPESEYPFDDGYELFAAGLAIGFLNENRNEESRGNYSQDFIEIDNISNDEYREAINFVWELVKIRHSDLDETEAWEYARQYADAGVDKINREMEYRGEFDMIGLLSIFEDEWDETLEELLEEKKLEEAEIDTL
jgi:hypothetical protein